jgi:Tol biopolymer transport system component
MFKPILAAVGVSALMAGAVLSVDAGPAGAGAYPGRNGKLAFSYQHCGTSTCEGDIAVVDPDGTGLTTLTSGPADDISPAWSPDGSKIAFASNRDDPNLADFNDIYGIYVMNADGTGLTRVSYDVNMRRTDPTWSPDGTKIAFTNVDYSDPVDFPAPWTDVWVMNADGSGAANLTADNPYDYDDRPAWSPDGSKIAFLRGLYGNLYTMSPDGSGLTSLITTTTGLENVTWSPDGSKMAIEAFHDSSVTGTGDEVWVVNADGTGKTVIAFDGHYGSKAAWSPDGTKIASTYQFSSIKVMNTDGTDRTTIVDLGATGSASDLDWQPLTGYVFGGFVAPVANPPAVNLAKAGAVVKVKFTLGGDKGLAVLAAGSPASRQVDCTTGASLGVATPTSSTGGGLSYDATSGQYLYGWKTDKAWSGTCRAFDLALNDGSHHIAQFKFR